jgi:predicted HicB family RNase H-like nuclease
MGRFPGAVQGTRGRVAEARQDRRLAPTDRPTRAENKDYYARITFDPSADAFHGRVIGIQDVIDFYGRTPDELREEFKNSVEEYLAWCAEEGAKPEKTWLGKLTIRVDEDLHRRLVVAAAASGASVNAWITTLLDRETRRVLREYGLAS